MSERLLVLRSCQVFNRERAGSFFVKLEPTPAKHMGHRVYQDATGRRLIVADLEESSE